MPVGIDTLVVNSTVPVVSVKIEPEPGFLMVPLFVKVVTLVPTIRSAPPISRVQPVMVRP